MSEDFQTNELTERIRRLLEDHQVPYEELDHAASTTCEESAKNRGEELHIGGKSLLFKDKKDFRIFVISASKQVDNQRVRKILKSQKLRFATSEELWDLAGVVKGAMPPFGRPLFPYDLYVDESIFENERIAFNAGLLTKSFILKVDDWKKLIEPNICQFAKEEL